MPHASPPGLLVLHGLRLMGMADEDRLARRQSLDVDLVAELLLDEEALGRVARVAFGDLRGWSLTAAGKAAGEQMLAEELEATELRESVTGCHDRFVPLNARLLSAMTRWQVRPLPGAPMAANDHGDWAWDEGVLRTLAGLATALGDLEAGLAAGLSRFAGYHRRFTAALAEVDRGQRRWVDEPGIDSAHVVWFQLHEDLVATLGLQRGA